MRAPIFEIKRFAVHDGDGIRTTVFLKGCPLRCVWCHNPEGLSREPQIARYAHKCIECGACRKEGFTPEDCLGEATVLYGKDMWVEELIPILLEDRDFYEASGGGVTLSGGECLLHAEFCASLLRQLKSLGIHTAVDTCGFVPRESLDTVMPYTDLFLYDLKAYDEEVHLRCTGRSNRIILENLQYLDACKKAVEIRIPYVPDYNDHEMEAIGRFLSSLTHVSKIRLLPYHNYAGSKYEALGMKNTLPSRLPTEEELTRAAKLLRASSGRDVIL